MFIPSRNPEWSNGARAFMLRTAASIVTASKFAPITRPTISSGNGATAAAHHVIIFLSGRYFSGKCAWARIFRISARARRRNRKTPRPPEPQLLQPRRLRREAPPHRPHRVLLRLAQIQVLQQKPVHHRQARHLLKQLHRLHQRVPLQPRRLRLPLRWRQVQQQLRVRTRLLFRHLRRRGPHHQAHERVLLQHRQRLL
jgi:hypothetical protein